MKKSTTPPTAAAMVVPGLNREKQHSSAQIPQTILNLFNFIQKKTTNPNWYWRKSSSPCPGINGAPPLIHHGAAETEKRWVWNHSHCVCIVGVCLCVCLTSTHDSVQLPLHGKQCPVALLYFHTVCWSSFTPLGQWSTQNSPSWKFRHSAQCSAPWRHTERDIQVHLHKDFCTHPRRYEEVTLARLFFNNF